MHFVPKRLYYRVPPCPECGSRKTGRYMKKPRSVEDMVYVQSQSLANGELIRFVPREPIKNCYCEDCGYEWGHTVHGEWLPDSVIEAEIEARETRERYLEFQEKYPMKKKSFLGKIFGLLPW